MFRTISIAWTTRVIRIRILPNNRVIRGGRDMHTVLHLLQYAYSYSHTSTRRKLVGAQFNRKVCGVRTEALDAGAVCVCVGICRGGGGRQGCLGFSG